MGMLPVMNDVAPYPCLLNECHGVISNAVKLRLIWPASVVGDAINLIHWSCFIHYVMAI